MTVVLRHNEALELNRVEYRGSVTLAELIALADYQAAEPTWLSYDCLSLIMPGADFKTIDFDALNDVFMKYSALFEPLDFVIFRRSAWVCQSQAARAHVDHWIGDRDTRAGMSSDLRQFDSFAEACDWLVLSREQAAMVERGESFKDIVSYTIAPNATRTATR